MAFLAEYDCDLEAEEEEEVTEEDVEDTEEDDEEDDEWGFVKKLGLVRLISIAQKSKV